ncbi:5-(carboxyamino)imidazole ribonucleotide synthase [Reinekea sp.]|jgi:5-(carboxyamino)imidazole ribonucleotide synthase|uniref:5-(carboxyamino)imidazole ribonucleotide synthase n=1 Tax=Reinekea sp. TaxID=1970455 RepID=UPI002A7F6FF3|nr:5-(carboxyamino)imidazole ribonucleotide synthase [Reinekea sp.]
MKLGIIGAGQLGQMMALAARPLGIDTAFLDPSVEACGGRVGKLFCADYSDPTGLAELADFAEVISFEFENVPPATVALLARSRPVYPPAEALATARDRWAEKTLFQSLGIATAPVAEVNDQQGLVEAVARVGLPAVLKTRTLGYDGKGQKVLRLAEDVAGTFAELGAVPLILEGFIDFEFELSCIGVRDPQGLCVFYPLIRNDHRQGILHRSQPLDEPHLQALAERAVESVMQTLNYVGVLAFEFFVRDGQLIGNEIAPRVHNSGHWTIEGSRCSQFENHVRAVMNLPLGNTETLGPVAMYNVIGKRPEVHNLLAIPGLHWHDYGKSERRGRKIAHITLTASSDAELVERCAAVEAQLINEL